MGGRTDPVVKGGNLYLRGCEFDFPHYFYNNLLAKLTVG